MSISDSNHKIINESALSIKEEFFEKNKEFVSSSIDQSMKDLSSQIYNIVNTTFSNFNSNYEASLEKNRSTHEKAMNKLTAEVNSLQILYETKKTQMENNRNILIEQIRKMYNKRSKAQFFNRLKQNLLETRFLKLEENIVVEKYFKKKTIQKIFNSWNHLARMKIRTEIVAKYSALFNSKYEEKNKAFNIDINKYTDILRNIEGQIAKEIEERRKLSLIYDNEMNKAANNFVSETNAFQNFSSSNVQTPKERSNNRAQTKGTINY